MESSEFIRQLRIHLKKERETLLEHYTNGLKRSDYWKNVGRVKQITDLMQWMDTKLKAPPESKDETKHR